MKYSWIVVLVCWGLYGYAQNSVKPERPVIGKPMPDVTLTVEYVDAGVISLKELRGKPVVIDFFSKGCSACFASFPRLNKQYPALRDKMHFILIAMESSDNVRGAYEKFIKKFNLKLPVAYDTVLYKQWNIQGVPYTIWIDKDGIVQAISDSPKEEQLLAFSDGKGIAFTDRSADVKRIPFESDKPFMVNNNGAPDSVFLQRSILSAWKSGMIYSVPLSDTAPSDVLEENVNSVQLIGCTLADLYRTAYFGRALAWSGQDKGAYGNFHYSLILEVADASRFSFSHERAENLFCYSLYRPEGGQSLRTIMQRDLQNFFGYEVSVEVRMFPYLALVARPGVAARLKTIPGRKPGKVDMIQGGDFFNFPVSFFTTALANSNRLVLKDLPLLDETGITGNIDITLSVAMTDLEDVKRGLRESGLDIVQKERAMKVIVIRDPKEINK